MQFQKNRLRLTLRKMYLIMLITSICAFILNVWNFYDFMLIARIFTAYRNSILLNELWYSLLFLLTIYFFAKRNLLAPLLTIFLLIASSDMIVATLKDWSVSSLHFAPSQVFSTVSLLVLLVEEVILVMTLGHLFFVGRIKE
jgi:hypothetical protein